MKWVNHAMYVLKLNNSISGVDNIKEGEHLLRRCSPSLMVSDFLNKKTSVHSTLKWSHGFMLSQSSNI
jgi:hypothetical protein